MAKRANLFKVGLLVVVGVLAAIVSALAIGARVVRGDEVAFTSYFDESVQGLDVGAPVEFRGVPVGRVGAIRIAPDHRHVEVRSDIGKDEVEKMGIAPGGRVPEGLRAQVGLQGITGVKYIAFDLVDPAKSPPPELPFPVPSHYVPATPSLTKGLEDAVTQATDRFAELSEAVVASARRLDHMLATLERAGVADKITATLSHADLVLVALKDAVEHADRADLADKTAETVEALGLAVGKLNAVLDRIGGERGLIASAQRATDALGDVGRTADGTARDLHDALRSIRDAADQVRLLTNDLERDPEMLLKGAAKGKSP